MRIYGWGGNRTDFDRVALRITWSLGTFGCVDPDTETITATRDTWADQNAPTSTNGGDGPGPRVETEDNAHNRRAYLYFPLPTLPNGCHVASATLKLFQNSTQDGGTRTIDAYRAASLVERVDAERGTTRPRPSGGAAGATNALANNTTMTWDVTAHVNAFEAARTTASCCAIARRAPRRTAEQKFDSRENTTKPQLIVALGDG